LQKKSNWYPIPRRDGVFALGLVLYAVIFFLPWSYDIEILNVSLLAWGAYLLHLIAPIAGILLALRDKPTNQKLTTQREKEDVSL
jgi:hypothetical protein